MKGGKTHNRNNCTYNKSNIKHVLYVKKIEWAGCIVMIAERKMIKNVVVRKLSKNVEGSDNGYWIETRHKSG